MDVIDDVYTLLESARRALPLLAMDRYPVLALNWIILRGGSGVDTKSEAGRFFQHRALFNHGANRSRNGFLVVREGRRC